MAFETHDRLLIGITASLLRRDEALLPLLKSLSAINKELSDAVTIVLISREGCRASIEDFELARKLFPGTVRAAYTGGEPLAPYLKALGCELFLSEEEGEVQEATDAGLCAALLYPCAAPEKRGSALRLAFDADAVLFQDFELSRVPSLEAFSEHETRLANTPLPDGPFAPFYRKLCRLRKLYPSLGIRLALITSRSAPSHERVVRTLEGWDALPDECFFLGGIDKAATVQLFKPDMYFDDMHIHIESSSALVPCARVLYRKEN